MMDVNAYLARIGMEVPAGAAPTSELLRQLQYAHCTTVPYENRAILRGEPLSLEPEKLYEKIVERRQGGFCFELNGLFGWLLRQLGYSVTDLAARYLRGEATIPMRRHRVLKVTAPDGVWLCDVGIGEICPREPVALTEGLVQEQFGEAYRFEKDDFLGWVLMDLHHGVWRRFYAFTEEPQLNVDYEAATFYCEHHPDSPFNKQEMFALKTAAGRITLDGDLFKEFSGDDVSVQTVPPAQMPQIYARFGLTC